MKIMNGSFLVYIRVLAVVLLTALCSQPSTIKAEVDVDEVFKLLPFSDKERQKILKGEIVKTLPIETAVRELAVGLGFLVKNNPELVETYFLQGKLMDNPEAIINHRVINTTSDFKALKLTTEEKSEIKKFLAASPGRDLNLGAHEIAAFNALKAKGLSDKDSNVQVLAQMQTMLSERYQAYRNGGVSAIAPYELGDGQQFKLGEYLQSISEITAVLEKFYPKFHKILLEYPKIKDPDLKEQFFWLKMIVEGRPTFTLIHRMAMEENGAHVVAARHFYASQAYNGQQELGILLPSSKGTLAVVLTRVSSDEVAGFGSSAKRFIGKRLLASELAGFFKVVQDKVGK